MNEKLKIILSIVFYWGITVLSILGQNPLPAEIKPSMPAPNSSPQQMQKILFPSDLVEYFKGSWAGTGKFVQSGKEVKSDLNFVPDLDNQCLVVSEKEQAPYDFQFVALWSFDSATKNLVMLMTSNHNLGARLFRSQSAGWQDNKIIFQSVPELKASYSLERFTFEKRDDSSFMVTYEISLDGNSWRIGDSQTFTRN